VVQTVESANLFFSEYFEGSAYNKAVEIFNADSEPFALGQCRVIIYLNGAPDETSATTLDDMFLVPG